MPWTLVTSLAGTQGPTENRTADVSFGRRRTAIHDIGDRSVGDRFEIAVQNPNNSDGSFKVNLSNVDIRRLYIDQVEYHQPSNQTVLRGVVNHNSVGLQRINLTLGSDEQAPNYALLIAAG